MYLFLNNKLGFPDKQLEKDASKRVGVAAGLAVSRHISNSANPLCFKVYPDEAAEELKDKTKKPLTKRVLHSIVSNAMRYGAENFERDQDEADDEESSEEEEDDVAADNDAGQVASKGRGAGRGAGRGPRRSAGRGAGRGGGRGGGRGRRGGRGTPRGGTSSRKRVAETDNRNNRQTKKAKTAIT
jgi:hypothetical protein